MKNKKLIIISIISSLLVGLIVYILFNPHYYILKATIDSSYNYASGVLTNNMFKGSFFLNVNFVFFCTIDFMAYNADLSIFITLN